MSNRDQETITYSVVENAQKEYAQDAEILQKMIDQLNPINQALEETWKSGAADTYINNYRNTYSRVITNMINDLSAVAKNLKSYVDDRHAIEQKHRG